MITLSRHARLRAQQRGLNGRMIEMILDNADVEKNVGDNCFLFRVSKRRVGSLHNSDKLSKFALIWSDTHSEIVTVLPLHKTSAGRRYRSRN